MSSTFKDFKVFFMVTGIICEFNPFHGGHKYLIDKIKKEGNSVICCMSGNFVQRGEFAVYDKFKRTKAALTGGADLVIELPSACATLSAEGFASSAVKLLEATGIIDEIAFGAETKDIEALKSAAQMLNKNDIKQNITREMKKGLSYPIARKNILNTDLLDFPNNILACEYLRFASVPCRAIKRIGKGHDTDDMLYSASAIRATLKNDEISSMLNCEAAVLSALRKMNKADFLNIADVSEGLENRIFDAVRNASSLNELYSLIKTKRYTMARIRRIILRSYLGIYDNTAHAPYIRILGFNSAGRYLLSAMKKKANLPIITKYSECSGSIKDYFEQECKYTDLYNLGYKKPLPCGTEQRAQIIIL